MQAHAPASQGFWCDCQTNRNLKPLRVQCLPPRAAATLVSGTKAALKGLAAVASATTNAMANATISTENARECTAVATAFPIDELLLIEGSAGGPDIRPFRLRWRGEVCL